MTDCDWAERISVYHDGELPEEARAGVEEHLRSCPACAAELVRLRQLSALLLGSAAEMPAAALARLHRSAELQPKAVVMHVAEAFAAAAAVILLASCVWLWRMSAGGNGAAQIPLWETAAVAPYDAAALAAQEQLARWIVHDLSRENGHD